MVLDHSKSAYRGLAVICVLLVRIVLCMYANKRLSYCSGVRSPKDYQYPSRRPLNSIQSFTNGAALPWNSLASIEATSSIRHNHNIPAMFQSLTQSNQCSEIRYRKQLRFGSSANNSSLEVIDRDSVVDSLILPMFSLSF